MVSALNTMGVMSPLSVATATLISTLLYLQKTHQSVPLETTSDLSVATTTLISTLLYLQKTHLSVSLETTSDLSVATTTVISTLLYLQKTHLSVSLEMTSDLSVSSFIDICLHCCACKKTHMSVKVPLQTTSDLQSCQPFIRL